VNTQQPLIVVGVATTNANQAALAFAMNEARLRGSMLEVVSVWQWDIDSDTLTLRQPFDVAGDAAAAQADAISKALANTATPPTMSSRLLEGDPGLELCRSARHANLLVVGATHKNVIKRLLLGSVSQYCIRHSPCPVVVVPEVGARKRPVGIPLDARRVLEMQPTRTASRKSRISSTTVDGR
jgi:nucleotide-binding universal stress UspA family protein